MRNKSEALKAFKDIKDQNPPQSQLSLLVYYCGHSCHEQSGEYYICCGASSSSWLNATCLQRQLEDIIPSRLLVILDCCYAAGFAILPTLAPTAGFNEYSYTLWASSSPGQKSWFHHNEGLVFTKYVISALRSGTQCPLETIQGNQGSGQCSICQNLHQLCKTVSVLSVSTIQKYVFDHIQEEATLLKVKQEPVKKEISQTHIEVPLAYANTEPVAHAVWLKMDDEYKQPLKLENPKEEISDSRAYLFEQITGNAINIFSSFYLRTILYD